MYSIYIYQELAFHFSYNIQTVSHNVKQTLYFWINTLVWFDILNIQLICLPKMSANVFMMTRKYKEFCFEVVTQSLLNTFMISMWICNILQTTYMQQDQDPCGGK